MRNAMRLLGASVVLAAGLSCTRFNPVRMDLPADSSVSPVWPAAPARPRVRFLREIRGPEDLGVSRSVFGRVAGLLFGRDDAERIHQPYGVAVDSRDRIFVADQATSSVLMLDPVDGHHKVFGGTDLADFEVPVAVALDGENHIFVSDSKAGAVYGMDEGGSEFLRISARLERPAGIAVHPLDGMLYIVDVATHSVKVFRPDGTYDREFGGRGTDIGQFNYPTNITVGADGELFVTDALNFRVQSFMTDGTPVTSFGRLGDRYGQFARPKGLGADSEGNIYVVEGLYDAVNVFDPLGRLLLTFGKPGRGPSEFWLATGLFVDRNDRIYVADSFNGRIQVFQYLSDDPGVRTESSGAAGGVGEGPP